MLQVHASVHGLKLITFDADGTLYADGAHMDHDNEMINHILMLLHDKVSFYVDGLVEKSDIA